MLTIETPQYGNTHGLRTAKERVFFLKIPNFWAWADKLGHFGVFSKIHQHPLVLWQADGALGESSDKSDFSLHVWDSFSQEICDLLFIFYGQKSLIYLKCSDFLPKKEEIYYFYRKERKTEQKKKKKLKI